MEYNLDVKDLCCSTPKEYEKSKNWRDSKGIFCSSLVAASFMSLGILPIVNTAGKYLPGKDEIF